jgi:hypothetical protein
MNQPTPAKSNSKGPVVLYNYIRYQDCSEESTKLFDTVELALAYLNNRRHDGSAIDHFQLFELGREIPLESEKVREEEVRIKETIKYRVKE